MIRFLESNASTVVLLIILAVVCVLLLNYTFQPTMDDIEWREEKYTVTEGDSLWTISGGYCPESVDRREWIDEIQALNDLQGSNIYPGQKITVLAPVK